MFFSPHHRAFIGHQPLNFNLSAFDVNQALSLAYHLPICHLQRVAEEETLDLEDGQVSFPSLGLLFSVLTSERLTLLLWISDLLPPMCLRPNVWARRECQVG